MRMQATERSVLHVLPHPGGGGETYVDLLSDMPGYRFSRIYLAHSPTPSLPELGRGIASAFRRTRAHDLLHVHGEIASGLCLPLLATRPSVVTLNGLHLVRRLSGLRRTAAALNLRAVVRAADRTICVANAERDNLVAAVGPAAARRALVVSNGVRIPSPPSKAERVEVRAELGIAESEPVGIWVGSLDERKNPLAAIRAAEQASVSLLVVGDGPLRSAVERSAQGPVRILGHRDDIPRLVAAADFYVLTSRREGLAFSLLEAMAYGLPAVVTDLPENVEAVSDAGVVVPWGDEGALVAAFRRLVANKDERTALGERARSRIAELFDAEEMVRRTRAVYDDVLVESRHTVP
ncbi:MAG: pglH [Thermoleophilia bacterium]|nr:pglH [Thermoleophilia bacterium]